MPFSSLVLLAIFTAAVSYVAAQAPTSFTAELPLPSSVVLLLACGITIVLCEILRPIYSKDQQSRYSSIPLEDLYSQERARRPRSSSTADHQQLEPRTKRSLLLMLIAMIIMRAEAARRVLYGAHCAGRSYEPFAPTALALFDFLLVRKHEKHTDDNSNHNFLGTLHCLIRKSKYRFIGSTFVLGLCGHLLSSPGTLHSTSICSPVDSAYRAAPFFQVLAAMLDATILGILSHFLDPGFQGQPLVGSRGPLFVGAAFIVAGLVMLPIAGIGLVFYGKSLPSLYIPSITKICIAACLITGVGMRIAHHCGFMTATVVAVFIHLYIPNFILAWNNRLSYPVLPENYWFFLVALMTLAFGVYLSGQLWTSAQSSKEQTRGSPSWVPTLIILLVIVRGIPWFLHSSTIVTHPIPVLMHAAESQHEKYVAQVTSTSKALSDATKDYHRRYARPPPPGFDIWFEYAMNKSTLIINDYDNIHHDLLPYWALSPKEVRNRVWESIAQPKLYIGGISIRNGKAAIAGKPAPTHRWNLDGIIKMIEPFCRYLPDMDLAFNLNDEPRVAVPYDSLQDIAEKARKQSESKGDAPLTPHFSSDRAQVWKSPNEKPEGPSRFKEGSLHQSFYEWGSVGCPPNSRARIERHWNTQIHCVDCAAPHRLGAWIKDWTLAGNICHQPDLANLHGFYLSPAALSATHDLVPVFSQSKPYGFQDIRYPSPWNYVDKAKYGPDGKHPDLEFEDKEHVLFWRGQTSEGLSQHGEWAGMARQRLVDVTTNTSHPQVILLPYPLDSNTQSDSTSRTFRYHTLSPGSLHTILKTDIRFTADIVRCQNSDCPTQTKHFGFGSRVDFQDHWRYAYLYDTDGAGFSGRFIPFLRSRSLPFKSALFREWWDGRLTPWKHFVPIDFRMQEIWATLAYFAGFEGEIAGKQVKMEGRREEGKRIAESGREWANKVIRKEDMEVYFFRLLLEWGRITDDKRDELGFVEA